MEWVKTSFITNSFMWHTLFIKDIKDMPQSSDKTCNWLKWMLHHRKSQGIKCQLNVVKFNDWLVVILDFAMGQGVLSFMSASCY